MKPQGLIGTPERSQEASPEKSPEELPRSFSRVSPQKLPGALYSFPGALRELIPAEHSAARSV